MKRQTGPTSVSQSRMIEGVRDKQSKGVDGSIAVRKPVTVKLLMIRLYAEFISAGLKSTGSRRRPFQNNSWRRWKVKRHNASQALRQVRRTRVAGERGACQKGVGCRAVGWAEPNICSELLACLATGRENEPSVEQSTWHRKPRGCWKPGEKSKGDRGTVNWHLDPGSNRRNQSFLRHDCRFFELWVQRHTNL